VDEERWAAAHYRVERDSTGLVMRKGQRRKATKQAIEHGDPVPLEPHDVVRIYDRAGEVVFEQDWGSNRSDAMAHEARIVEDLLHLDLATFCAKYGIDAPPLAAAGPATPAVPPVPSDDPFAGGESPRRPEQSSG